MNTSVWSMVIVLAMLSSPSALGATYTTHFTAAENPVSEGGVWTNGGTTGLLWTNVLTTNGNAHGQHGGVEYDDSIAHLSGFSPDHYIEGTVFKAGSFSQNQEIELLLRFQITANNARGYEILWNASGGWQSVRWENGGLGAFTPGPGGNIGVPVTGDVLRASITGNTITITKNGSPIVDGTFNVNTAYGGGGTVWTAGNPGVGFFTRDTSGQQNSRLGWSQITTADAGGGSRPAPNAQTEVEVE